MCSTEVSSARQSSSSECLQRGDCTHRKCSVRLLINSLLLSVLVFASLLESATCSPTRRWNPRTGCRQPPETRLHQQWVSLNSKQTNYLSETDAIVPIHAQGILGDASNILSSNRSSPRDSHQKPEVVILGEMPCTKETNNIRFRQQLGANERSLCRWYYAIQNDPRRYPRDITQARAKCNDDNAHPADAPALDCEAVVFYSRVLFRTDDCDMDGYYKYEPKWQEIVLGFSSARAV